MSGLERFTERSRKVLELSLREALSLGHNYVGTEHILLGLVRENEGLASRVLESLNVTAEDVRNEVIRQLSGPKAKPDSELLPTIDISLPELLRRVANHLDSNTVKVTRAADALGESIDMVEEWRDALEAAFGPKPAELSAVEWIASLAQSTGKESA